MREKKETNVFVGSQIQAARERAGLTQDKLSELIGVSPNHLSAIERGVYGISLENLRKVCRSLDVSADRLLFGDTPGNEEAEIARRLAAVDPQRREQLVKSLSLLLDILDREP